MRTTLQTLKDYQDVLIRITELDRLLSFVPMEIEGLEKEWKSIQARIEELKNQKTELESQLNQQETLLVEVSDKAQKYEKDLHEVTNTKEYHAVLKEIDLAKKKLHTLNEEISQRKSDLDEVQRNLDECQQLEKESKGKYKSALSEHQATLSENRTERDQKAKLQKKLVSKIPERILKKFERISERRNGVGLALCVGSVCRSCNVRVRQNIVDELRKFQKIIICESCKRILYFAEADES